MHITLSKGNGKTRAVISDKYIQHKGSGFKNITLQNEYIVTIESMAFL